jgi:hypothetical protein
MARPRGLRPMRRVRRDILSLKYLPCEAPICGHIAAWGGMIPKQHVPDLIRDVKRFSDKIMPKEGHGGAAFTLSSS